MESCMSHQRWAFNAFYLYNSLSVYDIVHGINFTIQLGKTIYAQKKSQLWAVLNAMCLNLAPKISNVFIFAFGVIMCLNLIYITYNLN